MFKLSKNIKTAIPHEPGRLIFEFKRPSNKEKNQYLAAKMDLKTEGAERLDELAVMRIALYDRQIAAVYGDLDGVRHDLYAEDGKTKATPADIPEDMKVDAVIAAFDGVSASPVNF